jgi:hypothetical protein
MVQELVTGVNGTAATNQCLAGYFAAWSKYCVPHLNMGVIVRKW